MRLLPGPSARGRRRRGAARRPALSPLAVFTAALALAPSAGASWWPFKKKRFTAEALIDAGSLGLEGVKGRVVALGDVNGDQNTDLFVVLEDRRTVQVYLWNRDAFKYRLGQEIRFPHDVMNIVPADFNADGRLDILAVLWDSGSEGWWSGGGMKNSEMRVVLGSEKGLGLGTPGHWDLESTAIRQPIVYDDDGSGRVSLLGLSNDLMQPTFQSWRNNGSFLGVWPAPLYPDTLCQLTMPHFSAFVDVDGDCQPDLVLHCRKARGRESKLEIYLGRGESGYTRSKSIDLPSGTRSIQFADMNRDGSLDLVLAVCATHRDGIGRQCHIDIAYNKQVGLCNSALSMQDERERLVCRGFEDLCRGDSEFTFEFNEDSEYFTSFPVTEVFGEDAELMIAVPQTRDMPLPVRAGDLNVNGFPDLLMTIRDSKTGETTPKVLQNVGCGKAAGCVKGRKGANARGFVPSTGKGWEALDEIKDAQGASWLDLDEDGSLDIMVQRTGTQTGERVTFIQNNFYHDAFFLKAQVLNGACDHAVCEHKDGGKKYSGNGASCLGASVKFTAFDTLGRRHAQQVAQLPQTGYHALGTPHTFIGLGRMNNYVEHLVVGTSIAAPNQLMSVDQLIPNSQVIINPPWPGLRGDRGRTVLTRSTAWRTELFLHPGDWIPWVAAAVTGTVVVLGLVVVWLGEQEKREDEKERQRALHAINFQAL